jgi:hypothetical protein
MSDEAGTAQSGEAVVSYAIPADAPAELSVSDAARMLSQARRAKQEPEPAAESAPDATAEESAVEAGTAPEEGTTVEDTEIEPEVPAIEPPRSWSKDAHERWSKLDRETQEFLAARDSEDQKAIKRSLQEAAEARKAAEAERTQAGELTKRLAAKLPELEAAASEFFENKYPEFKTYDDVVNMARQADALSESDPFTALRLGNRVKAWEADQQRVAQRLEASREAAQRQTREKQTEWAKFVQAESDAFAGEVPEFKAKEAAYTKMAEQLLGDLGFTESELGKLATGEEKISLYDRRMQKLLFRAIRLEEFKAAPAKAAPKTLPPVQRPGVARGNVSVTAQIQNLETQLTQLSGKAALQAAAKLTALKRSAGARN